MSDDIAAIGEWRTNADLINDAAILGYLPSPVCDLTYGRGRFWTTHTPAELWTNDVDPDTDALMAFDCRSTPLRTGQFETVVFDPPYKLQGTPSSGDMDDVFGTDVVRTRGELLALLVGGIAEASRLSRRYVLVKTQDQVSSGAVRWQTQAAIDTARALEMRLIDSFLFRSGRPQPEGRRQLHARRNYSTLLVFRRGPK